MPESNNTVKLKSTPVLLDRAIQGLQQTLLANLPWLDKAYGRGYKMVQHLDNGTKYVYPAAYIGGSEYAAEIHRQHKDFEYVILTKDKEVIASKGLSGNIKLT